MKVRREEKYNGYRTGKLLFKARSGTRDVNGRNREINGFGCKLCGEEKESIDHLIVECSAHIRKRAELDRQIAESKGKNNWEKMKENDMGIRTALRLIGNMDTYKSTVRHMTFFFFSGGGAKC